MASTMPVPDTLEKLDMYIDGEFVEPASGEYYAGLADKIEGSVVHADKPAFTFTRHEPLGVCVGIIPWNSPLMLTAWKLGPALAAGNTVVLKPSEYTSASALAFVELVERAGFPKGVVNVVTGFGPEAGQPLVEHPLVERVDIDRGGDGESLRHRLSGGIGTAPPRTPP